MKVMFLADVSCPRKNPHTGEAFDGKTKIWPFIHRVEAQYNLKNCDAGTMVMKLYNVTYVASRIFLKAYLAICSK